MMETIKELEKEIEEIPFGVDKIEKKALKRILDGLNFDYGHVHNSLLLKAKLQTLKDVLKLIRVKMTHENRNFVLDALSDLSGEIKGQEI